MADPESGYLCLEGFGSVPGPVQDHDNDDAINDGCPATGPAVAETAGARCNNSVNDHAGGSRVNDGCPAVGAPETDPAQCVDTIDDDADGFVNDGCPAFDNGEFVDQCGANASDNDSDGFINDGCPAVLGTRKDIGNEGDGVLINGVANNTIGGGATGDGNVITGNTSSGVQDIRRTRGGHGLFRQ